MSTATIVFDHHDYWVGDSKIFVLDPPYQGYRHVAVTVRAVEFGQWQNAGVEVVGCDENGFITGDHVIALYQSYVVMSHVAVLQELGYTEVST